MLNFTRFKANRAFIKENPAFRKTRVLDKLRKTEYARLDNERHVYLDYTGGNLYAASQVRSHMNTLVQNTYGNPHSTNPTSQLSTKMVEQTRAHVLNYFNAGNDYFCIFTANASGALKIVGECYPFDANAALLLSLDNHNSVNGIREFAKKKGSPFVYTPLHSDSLKLNEEELLKNLDSHPDKTNKLFAFPAQSNVSGMKHPLEYVELARSKGWDVLLDTAAFVPSNRLDLQKVKPDFASVSFYKIFGYPTGLGCLLLRKDKFAKLVKPWYAGGTIALSAATYDGHFLMHNHERFEEGTINYLDIPAIGIGLSHIEKIGIDTIQARVQTLTSWLLRQLNSLHHSNGQKLVRIFGSLDMQNRGGTIVMNFYDKEGKLYPFTEIEGAANKKNISIRTGCFCNPGLDETNNGISFKDLNAYFHSRKEGNFFEMIDFTGKLRGSVRISLGLATNFNDIYAFDQFARTFLDK